MRRVVDDLVVDALRHVLLDVGHCLADVVRDRERIRPGRLENADGRGGLVVEQRAQRVVGRAKFDARDVAQPRDLAVLARLHDDFAEVLLVLKASLRIDRELEVNTGQIGRRADDTGGRLHVLRADLANDVAGRESALRNLLRIEPHAHRIVATAELLHVTDAGNTREAILDVEQRVVAEISRVVAVVGRQDVHDHGQVGRALHRGDAEAAHILGQARLGLRDAVLHELLGLVRVHAEPERDRQRHQAVGRRLAAHVEHALDAVDLLLDRRRDGFGNHLRVRTRILRAHHDRRRHHLGVLRDRHDAQRQKAGDEDENRNDSGEDRPVDEELGEIHDTSLVYFLLLVARLRSVTDGSMPACFEPVVRNASPCRRAAAQRLRRAARAGDH